jgi:hypothetical protein
VNLSWQLSGSPGNLVLYAWNISRFALRKIFDTNDTAVFNVTSSPFLTD